MGAGCRSATGVPRGGSPMGALGRATGASRTGGRAATGGATGAATRGAGSSARGRRMTVLPGARAGGAGGSGGAAAPRRRTTPSPTRMSPLGLVSAAFGSGARAGRAGEPVLSRRSIRSFVDIQYLVASGRGPEDTHASRFYQGKALVLSGSGARAPPSQSESAPRPRVAGAPNAIPASSATDRRAHVKVRRHAKR